MTSCHSEYQAGASGRYSLISPIGISVLQSFRLFALRLCAQAFHLRTCRTIIISVALQQVDHAPNAKTGSEGNDEGLQHIDCAIEKIHILCAGIVSLWFLRWKPQSRNELAAVCGCRFRLLLSNFRLCFPPTLRFACVCCIVGVLLYGMGV